MVILIFIIFKVSLFRYGYPVFIAGTCDKNNSFHPTFCALASHENEFCFQKFFEFIAQRVNCQLEFVLADGAQAITNAASVVFPNAKRLMCWAHAIKNIDKRLKQFDASVKKQIRADIEFLQYARNEEQFLKGNISCFNYLIYCFSCRFIVD